MMNNRVVFRMTIETELDIDPENYDPSKSLEEQIREEVEDYKRFPELLIRPESVMLITSEVKSEKVKEN